jgi:GT2 family glycosyltransferase
MKLSIAAVTATYRRPRELERLLRSLAHGGDALTAIVVVDNAGSAEVRALVEQAGPLAHYVNPGANLGCGGGLRLAEKRAFEVGGSGLSHLLILDDDTVAPPGALSELAEVMESEHADLAHPLVTDAAGNVGWLPGLVDRASGPRDDFQGPLEEFRGRFGSGVRDFLWAQGICLLVKREAMDLLGLHRDDFWVRGEDLEFSLRCTARGRGVLVPSVVVQHLPPAGGAPVSQEAEYLKHCAMIQNIAFIGFRLRHGHRIAWTTLGALRRFFRAWSWRGLGDALRALWRGGLRGEPAGKGSGATGKGAGATFRERFAALPPAP